MKQRKTFGFTLVEMIVTLVIIITLSLLSFPLYEGRSHKTSMLAEGYALLGTIVDAQVSYYNEYGHFLPHFNTGSYWGNSAFTYFDPILGVNAINNRYFTSFNPYGNAVESSGLNAYKYHFTAIVRSPKAGTISLEYNKTQRFEPVVSGV